MGDYFSIDGGLVRFLSKASDICIIGIQLFIYAAFLLLFMTAGIYTYPALSRFSMKRNELIQFSFIAMCRHLPITLLLIPIFLASIGAMVLLPVGIIFMPGICLYLYSLIMEPVLRKYMTEEMKKQWDGEEE